MRLGSMKPIMLSLLCAAALATSAADKTVTDKEHGFEITFPEAWTVKPSKPNTNVIAQGISKVPVGAGSVASVTLMSVELHEGKTLQTLMNDILAEIQKTHEKENYESVG